MEPVFFNASLGNRFGWSCCWARTHDTFSSADGISPPSRQQARRVLGTSHLIKISTGEDRVVTGVPPVQAEQSSAHHRRTLPRFPDKYKRVPIRTRAVTSGLYQTLVPKRPRMQKLSPPKMESKPASRNLFRHS